MSLPGAPRSGSEPRLPAVSRWGQDRKGGSRRVACLLGAALLLAAGLPKRAGAEEGVRPVAIDSGQRLEVSLPAPIVDLLPVERAGGGHSLLLLVAGPRQGERRSQVFRFELHPRPQLTELTAPSATELHSLTALGGEAGKVSLFALSRDGLWALPGAGTTGLQPSLPFSAPAPGFPRRGLQPSDGPTALALAKVGALELYSFSPRGDLRSSGTYSLPVRARRTASALRLESPAVTALLRPGGQPPIFAAGPQAEGKRRLRTLLIDPAASEGECEVEAWSLLPAAEEVASSWYAWVDGRPILLVATFSAERLGIFEKQKLRVFSLRPDRTRKGSAPSLARLTASRRWQSLDPVLADVDGDGRLDLVLLQPEGLGGNKLVFEVHSSLGLGRFQQGSRRTVLPVAGELWRFGHDVDGDGTADLAAVAGGHLHVFLGDAGGGRHAISRKARWKLPLGGAGEGAAEVTLEAGGDNPAETSFTDSRALRLADLDGDGRAEILVTRDSPEGSGLLEVYRLH